MVFYGQSRSKFFAPNLDLSSGDLGIIKNSIGNLDPAKDRYFDTQKADIPSTIWQRLLMILNIIFT